jgi:hypothetical protein
MLKLWKIVCGITLVILVMFPLFSVVHSRIGHSALDPDYCTSHHKGDESGCVADHEHNCVWCTAKAVKSACYDAEIAKQLPPSIFKCSDSSIIADAPEFIIG